MVVDVLAVEARAAWRKDREKALVCAISIEGKEAILIKSQTYMNLSGLAVAPLLKRLRSAPAQMVVIHDDLDLMAGIVRVKFGGGDGGHRGVRSIADSLGTKDFARVRLGIGRPPDGIDPEEFVLSPFDPAAEVGVRELVLAGSRAVKLIVTLGLEPARNLVHSGRLWPPSAPL
jgi:PTH1 family peptidyl-tRNA hydrolase